MSIQRVNIEDFLKLAESHKVFDVRSEGEYAQAHIPGAHSLPLFTDEERKVVGTAYKQQGRQPAIKIGLDYYGGKMRKMVEEVEDVLQSSKKKGAKEDNVVLVHCWRGGMRSAGVAWLLDLYGFKVYTLAGGYKAFRGWVLGQFEKQYPIRILGGYTGSGKTIVLHEIAKRQHVIDLEGIAHHKGSAFGALGQPPQPRPEMFENVLALQLHAVPEGEPIWVEDESRRIGDINLPQQLWNNMRQAPLYFLDIPFEARLDYLVEEYGKHKQEALINSIVRIQKRLGGQNTKNAIGYLLEKNIKECFRILLAYYDKFYSHGLQDREGPGQLLTTIKCDTVNAKENMGRVLAIQQVV
jgi:tRNA 2-selenouridine synthase